VREELAPIVHFLAIILFQILFSILGSIVVYAYSRHREYHADKGGADFAGKDKMRHALEMLKVYSDRMKGENEQTAVATLKINGKRIGVSLFSSHPDIDDRIERLRYKGLDALSSIEQKNRETGHMASGFPASSVVF